MTKISQLNFFLNAVPNSLSKGNKQMDFASYWLTNAPACSKNGETKGFDRVNRKSTRVTPRADAACEF